MIVLRKANIFVIEKIIQPGQTEQFFQLDLNESDSFDWKIKIRCKGQNGVTKISSLYNQGNIESTNYAFLGTVFHSINSIFISGESCILEITNNELELMYCTAKVKLF